MTRETVASVVAALFLVATSTAHAALAISVTSASDLTQIRSGETFTLDIVIEETAGSGALALGFRAPEDLSVVGIGDFAGSAELRPALTTVRIDARRIAAEAAAALVDLMQSDATVAHRRVPTALIERETTAPPRVRRPDRVSDG